MRSAVRMLGAAIAAALMLPGAASAASPPECWNAETWARPGLERSYELYCERTESVTVATEPAHGTLTGVSTDGLFARWTYKPDEDAPAEDAFELELDGPNGTASQRVDVHVVPLSENTPPSCQPAQTALRTDGTAPAVVRLHLYCWDSEHDSVRLEGAGPGTHLDAPLVIAGGHSSTAVPWWRYRTATKAGNETATYWGTDDLGARSADVPISVQVGPAVNRVPDCMPNPGSGEQDGVEPIWSRPGAARRFGLVCQDLDGDAFGVGVGTPPERGTLTTFVPLPVHEFYGGTERWVDARYQPSGEWSVSDPFTVISEDAAGGRGVDRLAIVPTDRDQSSGCGWSNGRTLPGVPTVVTLTCQDGEGDPLAAAITRPPQHGVAGPPALADAPFGDTEIAIAYAPEADYVGVDDMDVHIADDRGNGFTITLDLAVLPPEPPYAPDPYHPIDLPFPASGQGSVDQPPPRSPPDQARHALKVRSVKLLGRVGDARVYGARKVRRLAITCDVTCFVASRFKARAARFKTRRLRVIPGTAKRLPVPKARGKRLELALQVKAQGRTNRSTLRIPARR